jgi:hypothetical protein
MDGEIIDGKRTLIERHGKEFELPYQHRVRLIEGVGEDARRLGSHWIRRERVHSLRSLRLRRLAATVPAGTRPNPRPVCHAEGRGFESQHPLSEGPAQAGFYGSRSSGCRGALPELAFSQPLGRWCQAFGPSWGTDVKPWTTPAHLAVHS